MRRRRYVCFDIVPIMTTQVLLLEHSTRTTSRHDDAQLLRRTTTVYSRQEVVAPWGHFQHHVLAVAQKAPALVCVLCLHGERVRLELVKLRASRTPYYGPRRGRWGGSTKRPPWQEEQPNGGGVDSVGAAAQKWD